ncbi:CU044_2847 family protein [Protofrankia symbiont of Coriaria ruscifolia]|uniref:CU044_2847 family protein n=1 Tax=Protofrankia symbiont of Coriaria ruscifolia TaxID=1306542 RepID=UPI001040F96C|nr:CU044_2847 family protein [Protofrankia symbiont of Coriaria ruscifolia]
MALLEVPVGGDGRMVVEVDEHDLAGAEVRPSGLDEGLELASISPGQAAARARQALEEMMNGLRPALSTVVGGLRAVGPDEVTVEFGLNVGGETGIIFAKGTTEVNFAVSMTWKRAGRTEPDGQVEPAGRAAALAASDPGPEPSPAPGS